MTLEFDPDKKIERFETTLKSLIDNEAIEFHERGVHPIEAHLRIQFRDQLDLDNSKSYAVLKSVLLSMKIPFKERSEKLPGVLLSQNFIILEQSSLPEMISNSDFQSEFTKLFQQFSEEYDKASAQSENEPDQTSDADLGVCDLAIKELARYHMTASVRDADTLNIRQQQLNALIKDITRIKNIFSLESEQKTQLIAYLKINDVKKSMLRVVAKNILKSLEPKPIEQTFSTMPATPSADMAPGDDSDTFSDENDMEEEEVLNIYAEVNLLIRQEAQVREEFKEAENSGNDELQLLIQQEHDRIRDDFSLLLQEYSLPSTKTNIEFARKIITPLSEDPGYLASRKAFLEDELEGRELLDQQRIGIATEIEVIKRHILEHSKQVRRAMLSQYQQAPSAPSKEGGIPPELLTAQLIRYPERPGKLYLAFDNQADFNNFRKVARREGFIEEGASTAAKSSTPDYRIANQKLTIEIYRRLQDFLIEPPPKPEKNRPRHK